MNWKINRSPFLGINSDLLIVLWVLIGVVVVFSLPFDGFAKYSMLAGYVDTVAFVVPAIAHLSAMSSFPQVTKTFMSIMWTLIPVCSFLIYMDARLKGVILNYVFKSASTNMHVRAFLVLTPMTVILFVGIFLMGGDVSDTVGAMPHEAAYRAMSNSRLWLGVLGGLYTFGIALAITVTTQLLVSYYKSVQSKHS